MFVARAAKDWFLVILQHRRVSLPAFAAGLILYVAVGTVWPKHYNGSALVELNPSMNWQADVNSQHLTATAAIRQTTTRSNWEEIVTRLHLFPETVANGRLVDAADYLASQVSIQQIEDAKHGGLVIRVGYTDSDRNAALGVTEAVAEKLTGPILTGPIPEATPSATVAAPVPPAAPAQKAPLNSAEQAQAEQAQIDALEAQAAPPKRTLPAKHVGKGRHEKAIGEPRTSASDAALQRQLQAGMDEGAKLQDAFNENAQTLSALHQQLEQEDRKAAAPRTVPQPERKAVAPRIDPQTEHLREELAHQEQALAELRQRYTDDYPDVVAARDRVHELQLDLSRLTAANARSAKVEAAAAPPPAVSTTSSAAGDDAARKEIVRRLNESQAVQDTLEHGIERNHALVVRLTSEIAARKSAGPGTASSSEDMDLPPATQPTDPVTAPPVKLPDASPSSAEKVGDSASPLPTSNATSSGLSTPLSLAQSPTVAASPLIFAGRILWLLSIAFGALAAFAAAWLAELRDPSIRTEGMLRRELPASAAYLGGIPRVRHEVVSE
jgi:hypothetical protein